MSGLIGTHAVLGVVGDSIGHPAVEIGGRVAVGIVGESDTRIWLFAAFTEIDMSALIRR